MDIQTKDGILLRNIPDGTPDEEIKARIEKIRGAPAQPKGGDPSLTADPLRTVALGGRAVAEGLLSLPALLADAPKIGERLGRAGFDWLTGGNTSAQPQAPLASEQLKTLFDKVMYSPETKDERLLTDVVQGATGAATGGLAKAPITTLLSGGAAGLGSGAVRESGGGPVAQVVAALMAGTAVPAAKGVLSGVGNKIADVGATIGAKAGNQASINRLATDYAERVSGADRDFIKAAEKAGTQYVPGAPVTTAEAIAQRNAMTPDVRAGATVKLQKDLTGALGAEDILPSVAKRQKQAMVDPLNKMAGGATLDAQDAAQEAAKAARSAGSGSMYEAIANTPVKVDSSLSAILNSPAGANALTYAKTIAKNDEAARVAAGKKPIPFEIFDKQGNVTGYTAQGLQYVKSAIDDMATNKTLQDQLGIVGTGKAKVGDVGKQLVSWMNKNIPGWEDARNAYAAQSEPVNQLKVAQALVQKLQNEKGDLTSSTFLNVRGRGEDALIKKATGAPREVRFDQAGEDALSGITKQIARNEDVNRIANSVQGAGTHGIGANEIPQIPHMLNTTATVTNFILKKMGVGANEPVAREIAQRMATGTYGELLNRPAGDPKRAIVEALLRSGMGTAGAQQ